MADKLPGLMEALRSRRALGLWQKTAAKGGNMSSDQLADLAPVARQVARHAQGLAEAADRRLLGPRLGQDGIARPPQCDWAWRATPWATAMHPTAIAGAEGGTQLGEGIRLFHDCPLSEITLRQSRTTDPQAKAPFVLTLDALGFQGSFLSLAMDLPPEGGGTLQRSHIVILSTHLRMERQAEIFARLNIRQGPNVEQLVSELLPGERPDSPVSAEFDLGFHDIKPAKLENAWIDLIFEKPAMNMVRIEDVTVTRRPRADI
ncbi:MAG: DUF6478 family protein [Pseudomonadota bacterium]